MTETDKGAVKEFWNAASCGEELHLLDRTVEGYAAQAAQRYRLEPYILDFAPIAVCKGKEVLEIGVGLGADHEKLVEAGANLSGVDLTERAIARTGERLAERGFRSELCIADAENLPFKDACFDMVYSWGVLHHSPDTPRAIEEVWRVLRPGGLARIMVYHRYSMVGYMLWLRYALLKGRPWTSLDEIYSRYLESPGTKAYSVKQARGMFGRFSQVEIQTILTHGDLLESEAGQRHKGLLLDFARMVWPRWLFRRFLPRQGLYMLISAVK